MAKKPDTPCGGCGKLLWSGRGSLPAGRRVCNTCRVQSAKESDLDPEVLSRVAETLDRDAAARHRAARRAAAKAIAAILSAGYEIVPAESKQPRGRYKISIRELGDRDDWRCHLCGLDVDLKLRHPDPRSASFDHVVPSARGGSDDPNNLRLAHWICNVRRGARDLT